MEDIKDIKLLMLGDPQVGKTTFITRHQTGQFTSNYVPTNPIVPEIITFTTDTGSIQTEIHQQINPNDRYDGAILMFDLRNRNSHDAIFKYYNQISNMNIPIVICGNKADIPVRIKGITVDKLPKTVFYLISAKSNYNFEKPFLHLVRQIFGDQQIVFSC